METFRAVLGAFGLTVDQLIIALIFLGMAAIAKGLYHVNKKANDNHKELAGKYHQLDKLTLYHAAIIRIKLGIKTVSIHRSGDHEIVNPINYDDD